jgi:proteasome lid subunit RPN8/RPN11
MNPPVNIDLAMDAATSIERHAQSDYPLEACGFLLGPAEDLFLPRRRLVAAIPAVNVAQSDQKKSYEIDPREWLKVQTQARQNNLAILGIYHSHPDGPAVPSQVDAEAAWPELIYLIAAVTAKEAGAMQAWMIQPDKSWREIILAVKWI